MTDYTHIAKIKYMFMLVLSILLIACMFGIIFLQECKTVQCPSYSNEGGFYEEDFYLSISAETGSSIYYTLDGSIPDENSLRYVTPILIDNATEHENLYSMRTDTSAGFRTDLIEFYQTTDPVPEYVPPDYLIDKCTIIRAVAINENGVKSDIATETYFVGIDVGDYDGCNVISLVTDPDSLFDKEKGIYVTGNVFENYLLEEEVGAYWRFWSANYTQRGKEWERAVFLEVFDSDGEKVLEKNAGIRIHGGVSRGTLPRSLNIYARLEYDGTDRLNYAFFEDDYNPQRITLTSGGNQLITQFNDYMMTERVAELNFSTTAFEPYVLFINGEYWGFYWLSEKYDESYFNYHYGVEADNVVMIKNGQIEIGDESDIKLYDKMKDYICNHDMSNEEYYEQACELIDINSFIDYYATMIYIARCEDWPGSNYALWRTKKVKEDQYSDGKWRWALFDCNSASMRRDLTEHDTLNYVIGRNGLFASMWKNEHFREAFKERLFFISKECFSPDEMISFIDDYSEKMYPILSKSWARFYGSQNNKVFEFNDRVDSYRVFFENRNLFIENIME